MRPVADRLAAVALAAMLFVHAGCRSGSGITPVRTPFNKGVYHYSKGNHDQAIAEYRMAVDQDGGDYRARFNLAVSLEDKARCLMRANKIEQAEALAIQAEQTYRAVLELQPANVRAAVNLAAMRYDRGERASAKKRLEDLIGQHPDVLIPRTALASRLRAEGRLEQARALLVEACRLGPGNLHAHYLLGLILGELGDSAGARDAFRKALAREPADLATLMALGELDLDDGRFSDARASFISALYVDPEHEQAHRNLARIFEAEDDLEGAVRHIWRARELSSDRQQANQYHEKLKRLYRRLLEEAEVRPSP